MRSRYFKGMTGSWPLLARLWVAAVIAFIICIVGGLAVADSKVTFLPGGATFRDCPNCPEMVVIPDGSFLMGSSAADTTRDYAAMSALERFFGRRYLDEEHPQHRVYISHAFALGKYLVTRGEFAAFVLATGYASAGGCTFYQPAGYRYHADGNWQNPGFPQTNRDPVVCVSWRDAQAYVHWLNVKLQERTGSEDRLYRLPSEAEWEYAARAGQQTARWWGNDVDTNNADCNGCGSRWDGIGTAPVGSFRANQFGLYDVLGNAGEWAEDCWHVNYDGAPIDETAWATGDCKSRVARGHDWSSEPFTLRSADRIGLGADREYNEIGFRVAKTLP